MTVVISTPYALNSFWKKKIELLLKSQSSQHLIDSLEYDLGSTNQILALRLHTEAVQKKETERLLKSLNMARRRLNGNHCLEERFSSEKMSITARINGLNDELDYFIELIDSSYLPPPKPNKNGPLERLRSPHIRIIANLICTWIEDNKLPLTSTYDVIKEDPWDGGNLSFASRLTEWCIWEYETRERKGHNKQKAFIKTIMETGQPRHQLKTIIAEIISARKSHPN